MLSTSAGAKSLVPTVGDVPRVGFSAGSGLLLVVCSTVLTEPGVLGSVGLLLVVCSRRWAVDLVVVAAAHAHTGARVRHRARAM